MGEGGDLLWIRKIYLISKCTSTRIRPRIDFFFAVNRPIQSFHSESSFQKKKVNTLQMSLFTLKFHLIFSPPYLIIISFPLFRHKTRRSNSDLDMPQRHHAVFLAVSHGWFTTMVPSNGLSFAHFSSRGMTFFSFG